MSTDPKAETLRDEVLNTCERLQDATSVGSAQVMAAGMVLAILAIEAGISLKGAQMAVGHAHRFLSKFAGGVRLTIDINDPIGESK